MYTFTAPCTTFSSLGAGRGVHNEDGIGMLGRAASHALARTAGSRNSAGRQQQLNTRMLQMLAQMLQQQASLQLSL